MKMAYKSRETFQKNKQYYDADSGALVTDRYINHLGGVYYVDKNGEPLKGAQTIQGKQVYSMITTAFKFETDLLAMNTSTIKMVTL